LDFKFLELILYNASIYLLRAGFWLASWFNPKAKAFVSGRKDVWGPLLEKIGVGSGPLIWIHCASVGEFEQGRPLIESFRKEFPGHRILLSFFSPSGYELRKNYSQADFVSYLPLDTPFNARKWVSLVKPTLAIFVKYEFWLNYTLELKKHQVPIVSISSIFRPSQIFFKPYGGIFRKMIQNFNHFFVQNSQSVELLKSIGLTNATVAGDTRFDRVFQITKGSQEIEIASRFKGQGKVLVAGSCWPEDMEVLAPFINEGTLKFIIAPHEITPTFLTEIEKMLEVKSIRFSKAQDGDDAANAQVLIVDNMGMLSRLYRYGEFAYVGGAFGKGLHNILEAACYGIPIFFGNKNYQKFKEANDLIMRGGAFEVSGFSDLKLKYEMVNVPETFLLACEVTRAYVEENLGATEKIMKYCHRLLQP
jgi:3-deoxy-D-manno-octulosonic-acid transferase